MDILGVGPLELLFILLIALIVLGPTDMVKAGRSVGRFLRKVVTSPTWRMVQQTSRDLRNLPNTLIREAGLEDEAKRIQDGLKVDDIQEELDELRDIKKQTEADLSEWTTPPSIDPRADTQTGESPAVEDQAIVDASTEGAPASDETVATEQADIEGEETETKPIEDSAIEDSAIEDATIEDAAIEDEDIGDDAIRDKDIEDKVVANEVVEENPTEDIAAEGESTEGKPNEDTPTEDTTAGDESPEDTQKTDPPIDNVEKS